MNEPLTPPSQVRVEAAGGPPLVARPFAFRFGVSLLLLNVPFGYGGLAVAAALATWSGNGRWLWLGGACYAASWGMLGLGLLLCGRKGLEDARGLWRKWRQKELPRPPDAAPPPTSAGHA